MALTGPQKVTVAEITYEKYEKIDELAPNLTVDQETALIADIAIWNARKNKVHIRLEGGRDGINRNVDRLLEAITMRVRNVFGLPPLPSRLSPQPKPFAGGTSLSDMQSRNADTDRPRSRFSVGLHRDC